MLKKNFTAALIKAIKKKDQSAVNTIRLMLAIIKDKEISLRSNGDSDEITVTFGVQGTPSDPMYNADTEAGSGFWILMVAIGAILVVLSITMVLVRHFSGDSAVIPKWKRE